jgi:sigma54-dependent transcription regulator
MNEALLKAVQQRAAANGQSVRFILEAAVRHYLEFVTPSATTLRPQIVALADESIRRNDKLLKRLAKA